MTLRELEYIIAVAKTKHFGKAANSCHVSQPALSYAIAKLEARLGVQVFERGQGSVWLTKSGEKIVKQAEFVLAEAKRIVTIAEGSTELSQPLYMGAIYTIAPYLFPIFAAALHQQTPGMPLVLQEDYTHGLKEKLINGQLDLAVLALPFSVKGLLTRVIYREAFVVLLPHDHPLSKKDEIDLNDLKKENLLLLGEGHCLRTQIVTLCPWASQGDEQHTGSSLTTLKAMVMSGAGLSIVPYTAATEESLGPTLCARAIQGRPLKRDVALVWRDSFTRNQTIDAVLAAIAQCVRQDNFGL